LAVQDRLDDILLPRALPDCPPAKRLRRFIKYPDFRQKTDRVKLDEDSSIVSVLIFA
jgi:hypothetical protein